MEIFLIIAIVLILVIILYMVRQTYEKQITDLKGSYENQLAEVKSSYERQIASLKENSAAQLQNLREMNKEQIDSQLNLIREQMKTTSEAVLKERQKELGERNSEQVSKIITPLTQSLNEMKQALNLSKAHHWAKRLTASHVP